MINREYFTIFTEIVFLYYKIYYTFYDIQTHFKFIFTGNSKKNKNIRINIYIIIMQHYYDDAVRKIK